MLWYSAIVDNLIEILQCAENANFRNFHICRITVTGNVLYTDRRFGLSGPLLNRQFV